MHERATIKARERLQLVEAYAALLPAHSRNAAARQLGRSRVTLDRYHRAFLAGGVDGLKPRTWLCGRPSVVNFHDCLTPAALTAVRKIAVDCGDIAEAWRRFSRTPSCPPPIAEWLADRSHVPSSLVRAVGLRRHTITVWTGPNDFVAVNPPTLLAA